MSKVAKDPDYIKLAKIFHILEKSHELYDKIRIGDVLRSGFFINFQIPANSYISQHKRHFIGCTALHFAVQFYDKNVIELLLQYEADVTCKNDVGKTPVRMAFDAHKEAVKPMLMAQVNSGNPINPTCANGVSHFHMACYVGDIEIVEYFLNNGCSVNQVVSTSSSEYIGYSPLHFAIANHNEAVVKLLLSKNANFNHVDGYGMTPLRLLLKRSMTLNDSISLNPIGKTNYDQELKDFLENELILDLIIQKKFISNSNSVDDVGMSLFHVLCTRNSEMFIRKISEKDINVKVAVNLDSPIWPGYTPLHFAAHFNSKTVLRLLKKGGNLVAKDAKGVTPLDICTERYGPIKVDNILKKWLKCKDLFFENGTYLSDALHALDSLKTFETFLFGLGTDINKRIPFSSPVWPGYTVLHLAVLFSRKRLKYLHAYDSDDSRDTKCSIYNIENIIDKPDFCEKCLFYKSDFTIQGANGKSPLHLAFYMKRKIIVNAILQFHSKILKNPVDKNGLSHLHIVCVERNYNLLHKFLDNKLYSHSALTFDMEWFENKKSSDLICLKRGSTPLHLTVDIGNTRIAKMLLDIRANADYPNGYGLSYLQHMFGTRAHMLYDSMPDTEINILEYTINTILSLPEFKGFNETSRTGLSYLHVACHCNDYKQLRKLIVPCASSINEQIPPEITKVYTKLKKYTNFTPLHFAVRGISTESVELLLRSGADVRTKNHEGLDVFHVSLLNEDYELIDLLMANIDKNEKWYDETGLTKLHVACFVQDKRMIKKLLADGECINKQINFDSPIWPGETPLHIFVKRNVFNDDVIQLFFKHNANFMLPNAEGSTPIHLIFTSEYYVSLGSYWIEVARKNFLKLFKFAEFRETFFKENPVNKLGISHFHIACMINDENVIKEFLKVNIDVNAEVDEFSEENNAGWTPLHFVFDSQSYDIFDLLLEHGANIRTRNVKDETPVDLSFDDLSRFKKMMSRLKDNEVMQTHLVKYMLNLLKVASVDQEKFTIFLEHHMFPSFDDLIDGAIKYSSHCSYITLAAAKLTVETFKVLVDSMNDITNIDNRGCNIIHYLNTSSLYEKFDRYYHNYRQNIEVLVNKGCNLHCKDDYGQTPLHYAITLRDKYTIYALVSIGCDVNIPDDFGKVPSAYIPKSDVSSRIQRIVYNIGLHIHYLKALGLYVHPQNKKFISNNRSRFLNSRTYIVDMKKEFDKIKSTVIYRSFSIEHFLTEKTVQMYPRMHINQRKAINHFFDFEDYQDELNVIRNLLRRQYLICKTRINLIESANPAFRILSGEVLPIECCEYICSYLKNNDLINLIRAQNSPQAFV